MEPDPALHAPFYTRYGLVRTGEREAPLTIAPYPPICRHGGLRAAIVAAAIDLVGSFFTREVAGTGIISTTDLSLRMPRSDTPPLLQTRGRVLRSGRTGVTTGVELLAGETLWAYGETTFAMQARAPESRVSEAELALPRVFESHPLARPLEEEVGVTVLAADRGEVELVLRPQVLNTVGTLQGALVALLVERAGECLAESRLDAPRRIAELDLRYLSTAKVGPVRSRSAFIGDPEVGMLRVELRDAGRDDRLTATALLRVAPAR